MKIDCMCIARTQHTLAENTWKIYSLILDWHFNFKLYIKSVWCRFVCQWKTINLIVSSSRSPAVLAGFGGGAQQFAEISNNVLRRMGFV